MQQTNQNITDCKSLPVAVQTSVPGLCFYNNVVPDKFHRDFVTQLNQAFYEHNDGHYDGFSFANDKAFDAVFYPMMQCLFRTMKKLEIFVAAPGQQLKLGCSLIGYEANGHISRHIDTTTISGNKVVVFSFGSPCVIHFYQEDPPHRHEKFLVPPQSMYIMQDEARYKWSHEILAEENTYQEKNIGRAKRYSLLLFEPQFAYREELLEY